MRLLYYFFFFYSSIISATEYSYPVAYLDNGSTILYIHQHTPTSIELFTWNLITNQTEQILWSVFNPAGLQLLPDNSGFSFIDNGRLHIKFFQKRSPKAIDFDEPLIHINSVSWMNEHSCYCSAYYNDNFALFELHDDGTMQCFAWKKGCDYMYPYKVGDQLFYIERRAIENSTHYHIMQCTYQKSDITLVADFGNMPIVFLNMISTTQGFVLEHAQNIDSDDTTISFSYHHLKKAGGVWNKNMLFSFSIPTNLLLAGEQRLYESLLPLLPRIVDDNVYFVDCSNNNNTLEPYFFDLFTAVTQKIPVSVKKGHYFVPMYCGNTFYCGGEMETKFKKPLFVF